MPQKPFESPQQLRRLAEENVEQARQLYLQFVDRVTQAMAVWSASSTPQFHQVRERAGEFAKENADAAFVSKRSVSGKRPAGITQPNGKTSQSQNCLRVTQPCGDR